MDKEYTVVELIEGLSSGKWTSRDLVETYIKRIIEIDQNNQKLNSIAEINPEVYEIADMLDEERKKNHLRSKMHGIPLVIKDNINTKDKMHTSASSLVLSDFYADNDAFIVRKLRDAGVIILGKANLSEFAYFMSYDNMPSGYGSRFGQVRSPYSKKIDPLGSSTGSAVAVAADLVPIAIGTETNGSLTAPAKQNSLTTIKPTVGLVSRTGIIPISHHQDTAGPIGKTVDDCAYLLQVIYGYDQEDIYTYQIENKRFNFIKALDRDISKDRVGFIRYTNVEYDEEELTIEEEAKRIFRDREIEVIELEGLLEDIPNFETLVYDFKVDLNHYLATNKPVNIKSLGDIINYNKKHKDKCLKYGQSIFEAAEKTSGTLKEEEYHEFFSENRKKASLHSNLIQEQRLDVLISVKRTSHAPVFGNPVIAVTAKPLLDDNPKSLFFFGEKFKEDHVLPLASFYETKTKHRVRPNFKRLEE